MLGCGVGKGKCGGVGKCWGRCGKVCWSVGGYEEVLREV